MGQHHSWVYLADDVTPGQEFSLPPVPEIADDVWLYGRIWRVGNRTIGGATWQNAVECMYVVDLGITTAVDEQGEPIGEVRSYFYGTTVFVPETGPIACHERQVIYADPFLEESGGTEIREYVLTIIR